MISFFYLNKKKILFSFTTPSWQGFLIHFNYITHFSLGFLSLAQSSSVEIQTVLIITEFPYILILLQTVVFFKRGFDLTICNIFITSKIIIACCWCWLDRMTGAWWGRRDHLNLAADSDLQVQALP